MTYIYRFTIKETGQCYVGQHRTTITDNPYDDVYKGSGIEWISLLKMYDLWNIDKFRKGVDKEILKVWHDDVSREEVGLAEKEAIEQTREMYGKSCINIADGSLPSWQYDTQEEKNLAYKRNQKKYLSKYYNSHKEVLNDYAKKHNPIYYMSHIEEIKEYHKQYYCDNKDRLKEYNKEQYQEHKEEYNKRCKNWRLNNKDKVKQQHKQYYETHKEEINKKCNDYGIEYRKQDYVKLNNKIRQWIHKHNYPSPYTAIFPETWTDKEITEYKRQYNNYLLKTS